MAYTQLIYFYIVLLSILINPKEVMSRKGIRTMKPQFPSPPSPAISAVLLECPKDRKRGSQPRPDCERQMMVRIRVSPTFQVETLDKFLLLDEVYDQRKKVKARLMSPYLIEISRGEPVIMYPLQFAKSIRCDTCGHKGANTTTSSSKDPCEELVPVNLPMDNIVVQNDIESMPTPHRLVADSASTQILQTRDSQKYQEQQQMQDEQQQQQLQKQNDDQQQEQHSQQLQHQQSMRQQQEQQRQQAEQQNHQEEEHQKQQQQQQLVAVQNTGNQDSPNTAHPSAPIKNIENLYLKGPISKASDSQENLAGIVDPSAVVQLHGPSNNNPEHLAPADMLSRDVDDNTSAVFGLEYDSDDYDERNLNEEAQVGLRDKRLKTLKLSDALAKSEHLFEEAERNSEEAQRNTLRAFKVKHLRPVGGTVSLTASTSLNNLHKPSHITSSQEERISPEDQLDLDEMDSYVRPKSIADTKKHYQPHISSDTLNQIEELEAPQRHHPLYFNMQKSQSKWPDVEYLGSDMESSDELLHHQPSAMSNSNSDGTFSSRTNDILNRMPQQQWQNPFDINSDPTRNKMPYTASFDTEARCNSGSGSSSPTHIGSGKPNNPNTNTNTNNNLGDTDDYDLMDSNLNRESSVKSNIAKIDDTSLGDEFYWNTLNYPHGGSDEYHDFRKSNFNTGQLPLTGYTSHDHHTPKRLSNSHHKKMNGVVLVRNGDNRIQQKAQHLREKDLSRRIAENESTPKPVSRNDPLTNLRNFNAKLRMKSAFDERNRQYLAAKEQSGSKKRGGRDLNDNLSDPANPSNPEFVDTSGAYTGRDSVVPAFPLNGYPGYLGVKTSAEYEFPQVGESSYRLVDKSKFVPQQPAFAQVLGDPNLTVNDKINLLEVLAEDNQQQDLVLKDLESELENTVIIHDASNHDRMPIQSARVAKKAGRGVSKRSYLTYDDMTIREAYDQYDDFDSGRPIDAPVADDKIGSSFDEERSCKPTEDSVCKPNAKCHTKPEKTTTTTCKPPPDECEIEDTKDEEEEENSFRLAINKACNPEKVKKPPKTKCKKNEESFKGSEKCEGSECKNNEECKGDECKAQNANSGQPCKAELEKCNKCEEGEKCHVKTIDGKSCICDREGRHCKCLQKPRKKIRSVSDAWYSVFNMSAPLPFLTTRVGIFRKEHGAWCKIAPSITLTSLSGIYANGNLSILFSSHVDIYQLKHPITLENHVLLIPTDNEGSGKSAAVPKINSIVDPSQILAIDSTKFKVDDIDDETENKAPRKVTQSSSDAKTALCSAASEIQRDQRKRSNNNKTEGVLSVGDLGYFPDTMNVLERCPFDDSHLCLNMLDNEAPAFTVRIKIPFIKNSLFFQGDYKVRIANVIIDATTKGALQVAVTLINEDVISAEFMVCICNCPMTCGTKTTVKKELAPHVSETISFLLPLEENHDRKFHCNVEVKSLRQKLISKRRFIVEPTARCLCIWECECHCVPALVSHDDYNVCRKLRENDDAAAGFIEFENGRSLEDQDFSDFRLFMGRVNRCAFSLLLCTLILGFLKASLGLIGVRPIDKCGYNYVQPLKKYEYASRCWRFFINSQFFVVLPFIFCCKCFTPNEEDLLLASTEWQCALLPDVTDDSSDDGHDSRGGHGHRGRRGGGGGGGGGTRASGKGGGLRGICCGGWKSFRSSYPGTDGGGDNIYDDDEEETILSQRFESGDGSRHRSGEISNYNEILIDTCKYDDDEEERDTHYVLQALSESRESLKKLLKAHCSDELDPNDPRSIEAETLVRRLLASNTVYRIFHEPHGNIDMPKGQVYSIRGYFLPSIGPGYQFMAPSPLAQLRRITNRGSTLMLPPVILRADDFSRTYTSKMDVLEARDLAVDLPERILCINRSGSAVDSQTQMPHQSIYTAPPLMPSSPSSWAVSTPTPSQSTSTMIPPASSSFDRRTLEPIPSYVEDSHDSTEFREERLAREARYPDSTYRPQEDSTQTFQTPSAGSMNALEVQISKESSSYTK